jgi:hypothetical protein
MPKLRLPDETIVLTVQDVREIAAVVALEVANRLDDAEKEVREHDGHNQHYSSEHVRELIFEMADMRECYTPRMETNYGLERLDSRRQQTPILPQSEVA